MLHESGIAASAVSLAHQKPTTRRRRAWLWFRSKLNYDFYRRYQGQTADIAAVSAYLIVPVPGSWAEMEYGP